MPLAFGNCTCLGCGCACDDIDVVVDARRIVETRNACALGVAWFGDGVVPARVQAGGRDVPLEEALDAAAELLEGVPRPLVYLAPDVTCEAQRHAIALADRLHGALDSVTSATALPSVLAAQEQGRAGATVGEIRNRADVLVFWGVDPSLRYPRYWTRYAPEPAGLHVPAGRASRRVIAVDIGGSRGPADADVRVRIPPGDEVATLTALEGIVRRPLPPGDAADPGEGSATTHGARTYARDLARLLTGAGYVAFVADAEPQDDRDAGRSAALAALTQSLNGPFRAALSMLRAGGNRSGADACLTSETGYPTAVDFARGYPRYRPYDGTAAARLERNEVDAVLAVGSTGLIPAAIASLMTRVPHAVIGPRASTGILASGRVVIDTAVAGIHESGTILRLDDVPLPARQCLEGPPAASAVLQALGERVLSRLGSLG
jgi:formylmethanofuran dehydrogenase subunit B